jgi:hypothetical protein
MNRNDGRRHAGIRADWMLARFAWPVCSLVLAIALVSGPLLSAPATAHAQDAAATARARELFAEGVELTSAGQLEDAEARFREALALRDAPAIRYNLASVLFQQEEYPEAHAEAQAVVADESSPRDIRRHATTLLSQIESRAGYARITLRGSATVDVVGWVLTDPDAEVPLAPGTHTATATRDGEAVAHADATVQTGDHRVVTLDAGAAQALFAEEADEVPPQAIAASGDGPITDQWWFWTGIAATAVGIAVVVTAVAVSNAGVEAPVPGNYDPGVLRF